MNKENKAEAQHMFKNIGDDNVLAIEEVLKEFTPLLSRIAASYEFDTRLQEDLLQEISLSIWRALKLFKHDANIKTYIAKIAHNRCVDHVIKQKKHNNSLISADDLDALPAERSAALDASQNTKIDLLGALRRLSLSNRQVITMQLEGFSYTEIGDILGVSEDAVTKRAGRAKQLLSQWLKG